MAKQYESNRYLRSILDPRGVIASIPDDKMRPHVLRQETSTNTISFCGGAGASVCSNNSGLIVLFPNFNGTKLGAHYKSLVTGKLKFDRWIETARPLSRDFRMARKISQVVTIQSSTISVGAMALSGTMNAIKSHAYLSELADGDLAYETILSVTADGRNKIAGVPVSEGLSVLSLPEGFDHDYQLLHGGFGTCSGEQADAFMPGHSITYDASDKWVYQGDGLFQGPCVNVDALGDVTMTLSGGQINANWPDGEQVYHTVHVKFQLLGLDGDVVNEVSVNLTSVLDEHRHSVQYFNGFNATQFCSLS